MHKLTRVLEDFRYIGTEAQGQLQRLQTLCGKSLSLVVKHKIGLRISRLDAFVFVIIA